jgi:hypothetical protein
MLCAMLFNAVRRNQLRIPQSTVVNILHKRLRLCVCKVQLVQALEPDVHPRDADIATEMLQRIDEHNDYLTRVCFLMRLPFTLRGRETDTMSASGS